MCIIIILGVVQKGHERQYVARVQGMCIMSNVVAPGHK